jgi:ABC-type lipoprotein release transport system permease subunit
VLSAAAGVAGVVIAGIALSQINAIVQSEFGRMPFWMDGRIPPAAMLYVGGVVVLAAVLAGVLPAWQATRYRVSGALRQLGGSTGMQLGTTWTVLIVAQVAIAVAGLPVIVSEGWREVRQATSKPAFAIEQYLGLRLGLEQGDPSPDGTAGTLEDQVRQRSLRLQLEIAARIEADPAVVDVTHAMVAPGTEPSIRIATDEGPSAAGTEHGVKTNRVTPDFFDAFDARVLAGRGLTGAGARAIVVNRTFAQRVFGDAGALGRRVRYVDSDETAASATPRERWYEIVGVVSDLYTNTLSPEVTSTVLYHSLDPTKTPAALLLRMGGGESVALADRLRELATTIEPDARIGVTPLTQIYEQDKLALRLVSLALGLITGSVLLLSAAGIYALVSFTVSRRRKEIGVRTALGAEPARLLRSVFARAAGQIVLGLALGVVTILALDTVSDGSLLGGRQALLVPAISVMMLVAGLLAVVGPARRALRIQPIEALRED